MEQSRLKKSEAAETRAHASMAFHCARSLRVKGIARCCVPVSQWLGETGLETTLLTTVWIMGTKHIAIKKASKSVKSGTEQSLIRLTLATMECRNGCGNYGHSGS